MVRGVQRGVASGVYRELALGLVEVKIRAVDQLFRLALDRINLHGTQAPALQPTVRPVSPRLAADTARSTAAARRIDQLHGKLQRGAPQATVALSPQRDERGRGS